MTVFLHEIKRNRLALIVWSAAISFMLGISILIYPEMTSQMAEIGDMFSQMGSFSAAFGMDQLNFGEFTGYFGVECGNVLGLGGAFFAALYGISALSKEEKEHTAEFLLTHPISRTSVIAQKLAALFAQILALNVCVIAVAFGAMLAIGESADFGTVALIFLAYFLMQLEIAAITFGISAFLNGSGLGIGLGLALMLYFLNILANLSEDAKALKYVTPFGYTDSAYIVSNTAIAVKYLLPGIAIGLVAVGVAFWKYTKKDIT